MLVNGTMTLPTVAVTFWTGASNDPVPIDTVDPVLVDVVVPVPPDAVDPVPPDVVVSVPPDAGGCALGDPWSGLGIMSALIAVVDAANSETSKRPVTPEIRLCMRFMLTLLGLRLESRFENLPYLSGKVRATKKPG